MTHKGATASGTPDRITGGQDQYQPEAITSGRPANDRRTASGQGAQINNACSTSESKLFIKTTPFCAGNWRKSAIFGAQKGIKSGIIGINRGLLPLYEEDQPQSTKQGGIAYMRINIKRLRRTADKMGVSITEDTDARTGAKIYALAGGILEDITEHYNSAEAVRDRLEILHSAFIDGMNESTYTVVEHPTEEPEYLSVTDYRERAELLGLTISTETQPDGGTTYRIAGVLLDEIGEDQREFNSAEELQANINSLWEISTEPEVCFWYDEKGREHSQLEYPTIPLYE